MQQRKLQLWIVGALVVGSIVHGGLLVHLVKQDTVFDKKSRAEYIAEINGLKRQLAQLQSRGVRPTVTYEQEEPNKIAPLLRRANPRLRQHTIEALSEPIEKYSKQYRLPPELVIQVIKRESNFYSRAISPVGAAGLMQIYTKYHEDKLMKLGITREQVYDIDHNIHLGCWILRDYLNETGSIDAALTRYVGGEHPTYIIDILAGLTNDLINQ